MSVNDIIQNSILEKYVAAVAELKHKDGTIETWYSSVVPNHYRLSLEDLLEQMPTDTEIIEQEYHLGHKHPIKMLTTELALTPDNKLSSSYCLNPTNRFYQFIGQTVIKNKIIYLETPIFDRYDPKAVLPNADALTILAEYHPSINKDYIFKAQWTNKMLVPRNKLKAKYE